MNLNWNLKRPRCKTHCTAVVKSCWFLVARPVAQFAFLFGTAWGSTELPLAFAAVSDASAAAARHGRVELLVDAAPEAVPAVDAAVLSVAAVAATVPYSAVTAAEYVEAEVLNAVASSASLPLGVSSVAEAVACCIHSSPSPLPST